MRTARIVRSAMRITRDFSAVHATAATGILRWTILPAERQGWQRRSRGLPGQRRVPTSDAIERGPGRHGLSNAFFLYLRDPDKNRIEIYTGDYLITDWDMPPVRWSINDPRRATFWGHVPPKSWFEEASLVEDIETGELQNTTKPPLFEKPDFVI